MRLGRAAFWLLFALNVAVAAAVALLLPRGLELPRPSFGPFPMAPLPLKPLVAYLLCLPTVWLGARRLHDVGRAGGHAWMPLLAFAAWTCGTPLLQPFLLNLISWSDHPAVMRYGAPAAIIALWLGTLLLAAGTLRTVFLWLEPSEAGDNRYGPGPDVTAPTRPSPATWALGGRMGRPAFWPFVIANVAVVKGLGWLWLHWPGMTITPHELQQSGALLYLPSFGAAIRRLHDRNRSGVLAAVALGVSVAAVHAEQGLQEPATSLLNTAVDIVTIYLLFQCLQPGDAETNHYGPPPGGSRDAIELPEPPARPAPAARVATPEQRGTPTKPSFGRRNA